MIKPIAYVEQPAQRLRVVHGPYVPIPIRVPKSQPETIHFIFCFSCRILSGEFLTLFLLVLFSHHKYTF